jgi:hypothetical protein
MSEEETAQKGAGPVTGGQAAEAPPKEKPPEKPEEKPEEEPPEKPPEKPKKKPPTEIDLDAAAGSSIQIAFMSYQNQVAQIEKTSLEVQSLEAKIETGKERLQKQQMILEQARQQLQETLAEHGIPDGWNWKRAPDGSYKFTRPQPKTPAAPPLQMPR